MAAWMSHPATDRAEPRAKPSPPSAISTTGRPYRSASRPATMPMTPRCQPSPATTDLRARVAAQLPFEDERDFAEARRGFLAAPAYRQILAEDGHVATVFAGAHFQNWIVRAARPAVP